MPLVHISGLPGAGKSTIVRGLEARGFAAIDVDDGLCVWEHKTTGEVQSGHEFPGGRGAEDYDWVVSRAALEVVSGAAGETVVFVAGSIGNRAAVADLFAARVALVVDYESLIGRLNARHEGAWGHEPEQQSWLLSWHEHFVAEAEAEGAVLLDSGRRSPSEIIDGVLAACPAQPVDALWLDAIWDAALSAAERELGAEPHVEPLPPER